MKILQSGSIAFELPKHGLDIRLNIGLGTHYSYLSMLIFDDSKSYDSHKFVTHIDLDIASGYLHTTKTGGLSKQRITKAKKLILRRLKDGKNPYIS